MFQYIICTSMFIIVLIAGYKYSHRNHHEKGGNFYELIIILGSGGHTAEMSHLLHGFKFHQCNIIHVIVTKNDQCSVSYFKNYIQRVESNWETIIHKMKFHTINRTNEVKQSYFKAIFSTIKATCSILKIIVTKLGNCTHLIGNGPGTCVPFYFIFWVLRAVKICKIRLIFIESWCRVRSISLTGKIVRCMSDQFIVHWSEQNKLYPWTKYYGKLI